MATIRDNIAYGRENAPVDAIVRAAEAAHADHFIRTLPDGYDTVLNEEASNISQGQRQLLTIARAVLSGPVILVMNHGKVIEKGTHEGLLSQRGFYFDLYNSQFASATLESGRVMNVMHFRLWQRGRQPLCEL